MATERKRSRVHLDEPQTHDKTDELCRQLQEAKGDVSYMYSVMNDAIHELEKQRVTMSIIQRSVTELKDKMQKSEAWN